MNKIGLIGAPAALLTAAAFLLYLGYQDYKTEKSIFDAVKNGEAALICHMQGGERQIDPALVVSYWRADHVWIFENGSSKTCKVED